MPKYIVTHLQQLSYPLIPILDDRGVSPEFTGWCPTIWQPTKGAIPYTYNITSGPIHKFHIQGYWEGTRDELSIFMKKASLDPQDGWQYAYPFTVKTSLRRRDGITIDFPATNPEFSLYGNPRNLHVDSNGYVSVSSNFMVEGIDLKAGIVPGRPDDHPWACVGTLEVQVLLGTESLMFFTAEMESYFTGSRPIKFLAYEGIDINLLRFALGPRNGKGDDSSLPYDVAVAKRVFDSGYLYNRVDGQPAFTKGAGSAFLLSKYLMI
ncbi:uncharacterized protein BDZ99DRAFT_477028 [Mytilinidion resinicola]|uniref:Uncharacterized protein n=1 Tax=Mytilinidion resinicola TaxID=574789 RepID=A0A6A6YP45_9PEZI|nr:uncharacterized protein BDZ99DRAFT_477028 [Mytilinidion resinicola]KAF2809637.1 hypothetical protein BDZ99DRAFT_477028 [Mytilinidion resinicola]